MRRDEARQMMRGVQYEVEAVVAAAMPVLAGRSVTVTGREDDRALTADRIDGRPLQLRITDDRPGLAAAVRLLDDATAALAWRPEGLQEIAAAAAAVRAARAAFARAIEAGTGRLPQGEDAARERLAALQAQFPAAALWYAAEYQAGRASWSDPTGLVEASERCRDLLHAGKLEAARAALEDRRPVDALGL